jgi:hypothetical protein
MAAISERQWCPCCKLHGTTSLPTISTVVTGQPPKGLKVIRKDIRDPTENDLKGFDAIVHLATLSNDPLGELNPELALEDQHLASVRLAKPLRRRG